MKLTIEHLLELFNQLPQNKNFEYVKPGKSKAQLINVDFDIRRVDMVRVNDDGSTNSASLTTDNLTSLVNNIKENIPFRVDDIFRGGGNTRSTYEAVLAHTSEFYKCKVGNNKHLIWFPTHKHTIGEITEYNSIPKKELFTLYVSKTNSSSTAGHYLRDIEKDVVVDAVKKATDNIYNCIYDVDDIEIATKIREYVMADPRNNDRSVKNYGGYPGSACLQYINFLNNLLNGVFTEMSISPIFQPEHSTSTSAGSYKYRPYITAIKSKPFLLLAGISGTGKSRIVRELARACWDVDSAEYKAQKPRNFEMVQVKPNWHDSSELIGYVSRIDGEKFVVGPFLKFIAKAWEEPDVPYFLCLDEMNLAPVEQYFAEYLSVVESRKMNDDGVVVTDPIIEYEPTEAYFSLLSQLGYNDEEFKNGNKRLTIPQNLIVVGTVNMDETTFSFSRKVLDRAMTIEMNEVDLEGGLTKRHEQIGKLGKAELVGSAVEGVDVYAGNKDVCDRVIAYLKVVNSKLEGTPFKIAYRTRNEFLLYVVNNLPYNKDEEGNDLDQSFIIARALDEITNMKILSRIEGDETKVSEQFLKELSDAIKEQLEIVYGEYDTEKFISLAKLKEMKGKLSSGYTSFWS